MDANTKKRYDKAGPQVVKALEKRHFEAYYVSTAAEAVEKVVELIPKEHTVSWAAPPRWTHWGSSSGWRKRASPSLTGIRPRHRRSGRRC